MSIYQDILNWSQNRQAFVQDALRRLITSTTLTQNDIDELVQLVKKECGDTSIILNAIPLDQTHLPTTVHRLAISPLFQNKGLAKKLMTFAEERALEKGFDSIRLDAFSGNEKALRLYERLGYEKTGKVNFPGRNEKMLK